MGTVKDYAHFVCDLCHFVYSEKDGLPDMDIKEETRFDSLPDDWHCPNCGVLKERFLEVEVVATEA